MIVLIVVWIARKKIDMADKLTITTAKGNRADVPVNLYGHDGRIDFSAISEIIDSAAAYATDGAQAAPAVSQLPMVSIKEQTIDPVSRAAGLRTLPNVNMTEDVDGDEYGEEYESGAIGVEAFRELVRDYVGKYNEYKNEKAERNSYSYLNVARGDEPEAPEAPVLEFDYRDANGDEKHKRVILDLEATDPCNDWFTTNTDGEYRNFRYERILGDVTVVE